MGPINIALVKLYQADQKLREAQGRLVAVSKNVHIQQRRVDEMSERQRLGQATVKEQQSLAAQLDLELKTRDGKIERLRAQQQNAKTNREYQTFLVEINTEKADRAQFEEQLLQAMASGEKLQAETLELSKALEAEHANLAQMRKQIGDRVKALQGEIESLRPLRDAAADAVPPKGREAYERLAERFDGEAMSALAKPDHRREEYACTACNMDLVTDIYNQLHSRNELVFCPSCRRILYIPDELPVELAVHKVKEKKAPKSKTSKARAAIGRQTAAEDVVKSIGIEDEEPSASDEQPS